MLAIVADADAARAELLRRELERHGHDVKLTRAVHAALRDAPSPTASSSSAGR